MTLVDGTPLLITTKQAGTPHNRATEEVVVAVVMAATGSREMAESSSHRTEHPTANPTHLPAGMNPWAVHLVV